MILSILYSISRTNNRYSTHLFHSATDVDLPVEGHIVRVLGSSPDIFLQRLRYILLQLQLHGLAAAVAVTVGIVFCPAPLGMGRGGSTGEGESDTGIHRDRGRERKFLHRRVVLLIPFFHSPYCRVCLGQGFRHRSAAVAI